MDNIRHIEIGLWGYDPAWDVLLDQIGVPWSTVDDISDVSRYSLVIVHAPVDEEYCKRLDEYVTNGGAVLYTVSERREVVKNARSKVYFKSVPPQVRNAYAFYDIFDMYHDAFLFEEGSLAAVRDLGRGTCSLIGIDVAHLISDATSIRKNFYFRNGKYPTERVSRVSKNALFRFILSHLEHLHHRRNLPFIHKWYFPQDNPTVFTFRIDSDKGTKTQIEELYQLGEKYRIPTSWFLDVKSHEDWLEYFRKFDTQEIGVHCYEHAVYARYALNRDNVERALSTLKKQSLPVHGITSPTGAWNRDIGTLFQELNFSYSSEFAYDYDNLPSFPILGSSRSSVVQLPVHPVCVGTLMREKHSSEEMIDYFRSVIDSKLERREPICLYHHPTHGHNEVFENVFQYINSQRILKMPFQTYAEWWKRRAQERLSVHYDDGILTFDHAQDPDVWVRISTAGNREAIVAPKAGITPDDSQFHPIPAMHRIPDDLMRTRKFTVKHHLQNVLDWWITTTE